MTTDIVARARKLGLGCGDGNCIINKPKGMHTNGGCSCFGERSMLKKFQAAYNDFIAPMADEITRLRASLALYEELERAADLVCHPRGFRDGNVPDDLHRALSTIREAREAGEKK